MFRFSHFTVPPPATVDVRPLSADEKIQTFLNQKPLNPAIPKEKWTISKFQTSLKACYDLREQIKKSPDSVELQLKLEKYLKNLTSPVVVGEAKKSIERRKIKRRWLKRRKERVKIEYEKMLKYREQKHQEIDKRLRELQTEFLEARRIEQGKRETEKNLSHVKKQILRLEAEGTDDRHLGQKRQQCDALEDILLQQFNRKQFVEDQWDRVLFGEKLSKKIDHPLLRGETRLPDFVSIRDEWDACIDEENGSTIPPFWVLPNENPIPAWMQYLENNQLK